MHELSIAISLVDCAAAEALRHGDVRVTIVHLKLGALSGVVKEALLFSYDLACAGTPLDGSRLLIEEVPIVVYCQTCRSEQRLESMQNFCCPSCGALAPDVIRGRELEFVAMEIQEREQAVSDPLQEIPA